MEGLIFGILRVSAYRGRNSIKIVSVFMFRANITTHERERSVLLRLDCIRFASSLDNLFRRCSDWIRLW